MNEDSISASDFGEHMVELTRTFGWHRPDATPCGKPVPIAEAHALLEISRTPGLTQQGLVAALNLRKSTVSRVVTNLQDRGWVTRDPCQADRRAVEVTLTEAGVVAAGELAKARQARMLDILERIPEQDRAGVVLALRTLIEAIHETDS